MPTYDYLCSTNNQVVEVSHSMQIKLTSWGELVSLAGLAMGDTPADAPVERLANGGQVVKATALKNSVPPCQVGGGCGGCA
ncbi:hypothetical protein [Halioxenophilus sp. WMMB6]|uniref:hypothetical protein n=1 Tax=Halioxenophilus sp. WMMB6 TaxID=3073815 RepID=UPI00295F2730|nr:hypothetical protein [Halioxenophilus sp. WMMB6]